MKILIHLFFLLYLLSCTNNAQSNGNQTNTSVKQDSLEKQVSKDTCDPLSVKPNYNEEEEKFRTIEFNEGKEIFRVVSDTTNNDFLIYVQRKLGENCWQTTDTFECRQNGVKFVKDYNDDGYPDIVNPWVYWAEIGFYNPEGKNFGLRVETGSEHVRELPNKVKFDVKGIGKIGGLESRLFRFDNYEMKTFANLKVLDARRKDDENEFETVAIELYSVKEGKETLIQKWKPTDFKAFMKNNGPWDYFDTDDFIEDFWKKNWQKYVPK